MAQTILIIIAASLLIAAIVFLVRIVRQGNELSEEYRDEAAPNIFRSILEAAADCIITTNEHGIIEYFNPEAEKVFGYSAREVIGLSVSGLLSTPYQPYDDEFDAGASQSTGQTFNLVTGEAPARRKNDEIFPFDLKVEGVMDDHVLRYVLVGQDMTERKRAERESEDMQERFIQNLHERNFTFQQIARELSTHDGEDFFDSTVEFLAETLGLSHACIAQINPDTPDELESLSMTVDGQSFGSSVRNIVGTPCELVLNSDARSFPSELRTLFPEDANLREMGIEAYFGVPLAGQNGEKLGILSVMDREPIQEAEFVESILSIFAIRVASELERLRNEAQLKESEERFHRFFNESTEGILVFTADGEILDANPAVCRMFGYIYEDFCSLTLSALVDPGSSDCFGRLQDFSQRENLEVQEGQSGLDESGSGFLERAEGVRKDGRQFSIEVRGSRFLLGGVERYVGKITDITEFLRIEREREQSKQLESIGVLAGGLAHDFNNILLGIVGNVALASETIDADNDAFQYLSQAETALGRASALTDQLLTFAKGGAPMRQSISIRELLVDATAFGLSGSNVKPDFEVDEKLWRVDVDSAQFSQVIQGICLNASQAMSNGGTFIVCAHNMNTPQGNNVRIAFADQGIGLCEADIARVFEPYFSTKEGSAGMGLATGYSVIKQHGGTIEMDSTVGIGSTVSITLPASDQQDEAPEKQESVTEDSCGRALVMDDEDFIRELAERILTGYGYTVDCAADGTEALNMYSEALEQGRRYDVVTLDLTVPGGVGGRKTIENLYKVDPTVVAIVCSGYSNDPVMSDPAKYHFSGVLSKPFRPKQLHEVIQCALTEAKQSEHAG